MRDPSGRSASGPRPSSFRAAMSVGLACALLAGCGADEPLLPSSVETPPPGAEERSPYDGIELPPFEPLPLSPPELERPAWTPTLPPSTPPPAAREQQGPPAPPAPSLDDLLRMPSRPPSPAKSAPRPVDLVDVPEPAPPAATEPGTIDRLRDRIRLERRSEAIGPKGPRQGTRSETDAGIRVPIERDVSVEGGVRIDERDEPGAPEPERKSTPRVGVEVRF